MSTVPKGRVKRIAYYEARVAKWVENAELIGADPALVAAVQAQAIEARLALKAQKEAQSAARSATQQYNRAVRKLGKLGRNVMLQIRSAAGRTGDEVYALASISPPAKRSPIGKPGTPYKFKAVLHPSGDLLLTWKCDHPRGAEGTLYQIYRSIEGSSAQAYLGGSGTKEFIDSTLPRGCGSVTYSIQAIRTSAFGVAANFTVHFGSDVQDEPTIALAGPVSA